MIFLAIRVTKMLDHYTPNELFEAKLDEIYSL